MGCPIRTPADQKLFAPPRRFSQLVTSFFASENQGIHRMLLVTFSSIILFLISFAFIMSKNLIQGMSPRCSVILLTAHLSNLTSSNLWRISESNRWPPACKAGALASWANSPKLIFQKTKNFIPIPFSFRLSSFVSLSSPTQIWTGDLYIISVAL